MDDSEPNLLLRIDHVKYRKAGDGRSPIGRLSIFKEYVEWRDNGSSEVLTLKFIHIKGQRVSPPHKSKVQLQLVLQNEEQATFVFLNPDQNKDTLGKERDAVKETLQQALISHRAHVNQLAASVEKQSKSVELEAKQKILRENKHLEQLYKSLVATKLISPQDFWQDYYNQDGVSEDKIGINGAFLANIAQQEGTNGVRLNLNPEIIQAIFTTYPAVEKKHLELVPHEMTESAFWSKFFQSHYFHREREVLPNPKDPFADCVKTDEEEMTKISADGIARKRFDLEHLDDYALRDFIYKTESTAKSAKATLIKRCNYLSEKILATSWKEGEASSSAASQKKGFGVLDRVVAETENRLESEDLANEMVVDDVQIVKIDESAVTEWKKYPVEEAQKYKSLVLRFFDSNSDEDILTTDDMDFEEMINGNGVKNGNSKTKKDETASMPEKWNLNSTELGELRDLHSAVRELCRHFWSCFPPINPELETKLERMGETLKKFKTDNLLQSQQAANRLNIQHCVNMVDLALEKYSVYLARKKK